MTSKLNSVVHQAIKTFQAQHRLIPSSVTSVSVDESAFTILKTLVNQLTFFDVNIPLRLFSRNDYAVNSTNPVEYLPIHEDRVVTVGIFIIKMGARIPLHDHPNMYGILKVLRGELEVTSYNILDKDFSPSNRRMKVARNSTVRLTAENGCSELSPVLNNIHEVKCINGPAVFLDILAPPYDDESNSDRSCHYFIESLSDGLMLEEIPCPLDWSQ